jgi:SAM-dependent methyltransferase
MPLAPGIPLYLRRRFQYTSTAQPVDKSATAYRIIDRAFESPIVFNLNQVLLDGGKTRHIRRFLADASRESVLDIGCGPGNWATIAEGRYLGIDTSESFIRGASRRYRGDATKRFVVADATMYDFGETFDLGIMVSVLHHLSDEETKRLLPSIASVARRLFVLDLYPNPANPVSAWLYAMDRGDHIRGPDRQAELLESCGSFRISERGDYFSTSRLYRHTLFLLDSNRF